MLILALAVDVERLPIVLVDGEGLAGAGVARQVHVLLVALAAVDLLVVVVLLHGGPGLSLGGREVGGVGTDRDHLLCLALAVHVVGLAGLVHDHECFAFARAIQRDEEAVARPREDVGVVGVTGHRAPGLALGWLEVGLQVARDRARLGGGGGG